MARLVLKIILPIVSVMLLIALGSVGFFAYSAAQDISAEFSPSAPVTLTEPLSITFSQPMRDEGFRERIRISPATNVLVSWENDLQTLTLSPQTVWKPDASYAITLPEGKTQRYAMFDGAQFTFDTIAYPRVSNIWPNDGARDAVVGIEDPIIVELNKSAEGFWIEFSITPENDVVYQNNDNRSRFEILPKEPFKNGKDYEITVSAYPENSADPALRKVLATSSFKTLPDAPSFWAQDPNERIEQVKRFSKAKIAEGKYIDINLSAQVMSLFENGKLLDAYLVSSGLAGMDTPKGTFQIHNKHPRPWSRQYELFMPFWMAITSDGKYGIHELPEWPGGYKEGANHLGIPVSHGCVRLGIGPAERVYNWAEIGTPVVVH